MECHNLDQYLTYDQIEAYVESKNKRLPTEQELGNWLKNNERFESVFKGGDWVPIRDTDGNKDYIFVGHGKNADNKHFPGKSHTKYHGWPKWADTTGTKTVCTLPLYSNIVPQDIECHNLDQFLTYNEIEKLVHS